MNGKILIVGNNNDIINSLNEILSKKDYSIFESNNFRSAIEEAKKVNPDMLIIEGSFYKNNPGIVNIRENKGLKKTPVIFVLESSNDSEIRKNIFKLELTNSLTTPLVETEVIAKVKNLLDLKNLKKELNDYKKELLFANSQLVELNKEFNNISNSDLLTGLPNKKEFDLFIKKEWRRAIREKSPISLILIDIDHFRDLNNTYGRQVGNFCLNKIADVIKSYPARATDFCARYGEDSFTIVLPNTNIEGTKVVIEKIQQNIKDLKLENKTSKVSKNLTVTMGISSIIPNREQNPSDLITKADAALHKAKKGKRNTAEYYPITYEIDN